MHLCPDIIVLLILGIAFIVAFALWEIRVERMGKTPPLACMSIFTMEKGRVSLLFLFGVSRQQVNGRDVLKLRFQTVPLCCLDVQFRGVLRVHVLYDALFPRIPAALVEGYRGESA